MSEPLIRPSFEKPTKCEKMELDAESKRADDEAGKDSSTRERSERDGDARIVVDTPSEVYPFDFFYSVLYLQTEQRYGLLSLGGQRSEN
jgi:hypothetical protein